MCAPKDQRKSSDSQREQAERDGAAVSDLDKAYRAYQPIK